MFHSSNIFSPFNLLLFILSQTRIGKFLFTLQDPAQIIPSEAFPNPQIVLIVFGTLLHLPEGKTLPCDL